MDQEILKHKLIGQAGPAIQQAQIQQYRQQVSDLALSQHSVSLRTEVLATPLIKYIFSFHVFSPSVPLSPHLYPLAPLSPSSAQISRSLEF